MDRSQPPLRWMSYEASAAGLRLIPVSTAWEIKANLAVHESLTTVWWLFEALPWKRLTYRNEHGQTNRYARNATVLLFRLILTSDLAIDLISEQVVIFVWAKRFIALSFTMTH